MSLWNKLEQAAFRFRQSLKSFLSRKPDTSLAEIRRQILNQLESKIESDSSGKIFPFAKIQILLQASSKSLRDDFRNAFLLEGSLKEDIRQRLETVHAGYSGNLEVDIEIDADSAQGALPKSSHPKFEMAFLKPEPIPQGEVPELNLVITKGIAEQPAYTMKRERILIGCLSEVHDREGRMVRRNDVVFLDTADDINCTVSDAHARIWFEPKEGEFYVMDETSRYGTRIMRQGRSIDVPAGGEGGIRLQSGDEICFGQASFQFELTGHQ
jgi:hypothetical protein